METGVQNWMVYMKMEIIKLDLHCSFIVNVATQHYLQKVVSRTLICVRIKYTVKQKLTFVLGWKQKLNRIRTSSKMNINYPHRPQKFENLKRSLETIFGKDSRNVHFTITGAIIST